MEWVEIRIAVPAAETEAASAIANMTVPYGIYIEDYSDLCEQAPQIAHIDLIDEALLAKNREESMIHIYISECDNAAEALSFLQERLSAAGISARVSSEGVEDTDWNENWKKYFHPFEVGKTLAVCPSWEHYDNAEHRTVLQIDPGAAFGTGTHATTSLCMELLEKTVQPGDRVLDIGCGSGILAITAALLGAESAFGVDIDAQSVKTAKENALANGVGDRVGFSLGDLDSEARGTYRVICANIVADVIIRLLATVGNYMDENSRLLLSGIIDLRADEVRAEVTAKGFEIVEERTRENWIAMLVQKKV